MIPRGFTTLLFGSGLAQVIAIAALPVLGRLYDPASFGQLGALMATVSLAAAISHCRFQLAIPVTKMDDEARSLLWLTCGLSLILSLPLVLMLSAIVGQRPDGLSIGAFIALAAAATFLTAQIDIFSYWRSRAGRFGVSARNALSRNVVTVVFQICLASVTGLGLVAGVMIGALSAACLGWFDAVRHGMRPFQPPPIHSLIEVARKFSHFALFGVPQGWLAAISWNAMPLLLLRFDTMTTAGQYWIAYRLLLAPVTLFGSAYRQAMLPFFSRTTVSAARNSARQHAVLLFAAGLTPMILLLNFGQPIFEFVVGPKWSQAGVLAGLLAIGIFADALKVPAICLLQYQSRQKTIFWWEGAIVATRYGVSVPLLIAGDTNMAIAAFAIAGALGWSMFSIAQLWPQSRQVADA